MTTTDTQPSAGFRRRLALHGEDWLALGMLAVLFVFALAGAFTHMHDWTVTAIDEALRVAHVARGAAGEPARTPDWFGWSNAVTSEIMPTYALLTVRKRQRQGRPIGGPATLFVGSSVLSVLAQLSATGVRLPYDAQLLVTLPAFALMILGSFKFSDMSYARRVAAEAEAEAERQAELARRHEAEAEERRAELERQRIAAEADAAERLARINATAQTERDRLAADERRREAEARDRRETEAARIRAEADAEARRIEAEAVAARERAEADRLAADAATKRQALALLARPVGDAPAPAAEADEPARRKRRTREQTEAIVDATLGVLPAGTTRDAAVKAVARALDSTERYARDFVPDDWRPGSSAPAAAGTHHEGDGSSAGRRHLAVVGSA